jgi:peroxiredoxin/outer membrane lipoprotein-sorting protein
MEVSDTTRHRWLAPVIAAGLLSGTTGATYSALAAEPGPSPVTFEDEPAAHGLYDQMHAVIRKAESLSYVSRCKWGGAGKEGGGICRVWLRKPNHFRVETEPLSEGDDELLLGGKGGVLIGDGETMWTYWPKGRPDFWPDKVPAADRETRFSSYMTKPAPPKTISISHEVIFILAMHVMELSTFHGYTDELRGHYLDGVRSLGTEEIGDEVCDKIEVSLVKGQRTRYFWLSQRDHIPRKLKQIVRVNREDWLTEEWSNVTLNADQPDDLFNWTPPEGWTQWKVPDWDSKLLAAGTEAPDFELASADGGRIRLSDYRGQVVWLNFWKAGCPPCREELSHLQEMHRQFSDKGLVILGFNCMDGKKIAMDAMSHYGVTYPMVLDDSPEAVNICDGDYAGGPLPMNYIIDRQGKVMDAWFGYQKGSHQEDAALLKAGGELAETFRQERKAQDSLP